MSNKYEDYDTALQGEGDKNEKYRNYISSWNADKAKRDDFELPTAAARNSARDQGRETYYADMKPVNHNLFQYKSASENNQWRDVSEGCDTTSKDDKLREILMTQLFDMAKTTTDKVGDEDDNGCAFACGEDAELDRMQKMYKNFNSSLGTTASQTGTLCGIGDFENNPRIQVLESQRKVLEFVSFSFLHQTCEGTNNCNPHKHVMPRELLKCCGLYEGAPLFYDGDLQAVGSYLAGPQGSPKGLTPAANGHCANFYMSGTIAPGRDKQLYVNVCYIATTGERGALNSADGKPIGMKWVKANRLERAKFEAMREIDAKIIAAKRMVLQMNHKMLQLQQSLVGLNPNVMGGYGGYGGQDELLTNRLRAVVSASTRRVRNVMGRRNGEMEDRHRSMLPQLGMSPSGRAGSELRAIDSLRRKASKRAGSRRARSRASRASSRSRSASR